MTQISTACPLFDEYNAQLNEKKFTYPGKANFDIMSNFEKSFQFDGACCADGWLNQGLV